MRRQGYVFTEILIKMSFDKFVDKYFEYFNGLIVAPGFFANDVFDWKKDKVIELSETGEYYSDPL